RHDLPGLAIPALDDVELGPGLLDRVAAVRRKAFDGGDLSFADRGDRKHAGADCLAVEVDGTGATLRHPAPELRPGKPEDISQDPEKRHVARRVDLSGRPVHGDLHGTSEGVARLDSAKDARVV